MITYIKIGFTIEVNATKNYIDIAFITKHRYF